MGASTIQVNKESQAGTRVGFSYDVLTRQFDASFWNTITGAPAINANKIRLSSATITSYTQFKFGRFIFPVNVPTTPSAGEAKKWGLLLPGRVTTGSAYFEIVGAVFRAVSYDDSGNAQTTTLTWSGYEAVETDFEIEWEKGYILFKISGVVVASHQTRVGQTPLPLYIINGDADNTDVGTIIAKEVAQYA